MAALPLIKCFALLLLAVVQCTGFVTTTVVTSPSTTGCGSDFGGCIAADRSSLFGSSRPREETSPMHAKRRLMFRAIQRSKATAARAKILSLFHWCRKKYLSTVMALAIALSCLFGPLLALPANANASSEVAPNGGVLITKIRETPANEVGSPLLEADAEEQCEVIDNSETAAVEEDQSSDMAEGLESSTPSKPSTLSGGSKTECERKDATIEVKQRVRVEPKTKSRQSTTKTSRVVAAATATGGGAYLVAKTRISKDGDDDDEVGVDEERIEATRKVTPTTQTTQSLPLCDPVHLKAREEQPKSPAEEARLATRYAQISDVGERAFQILVDLGMIELHQ